MLELFQNNASARLALALAQADTSLTVQTGQGSRFPIPRGGQFFRVIVDPYGPSPEILYAFSLSGDTLAGPLLRGQEGTSAPTSWPAGTLIAIFVSRLSLDSLRDGYLVGKRIHSLFIPNNTTSTSVMGANNGTGTVSHPALATTNMQNASRRTRYASATTAGSAAGWRGVASVWRGNAARLGGFLFYARFTQSINATGYQAMFGVSALTTALAGDPDQVNDTLCMGYRAADPATGNWQLIRRNDVSAVVVDLGVNAPRDTSTVFDLYIWCGPNGSTMGVRVINVSAGVEVLNAEYSTNLPRNNQFLVNHLEQRNGAVAAAVQPEIMQHVLVSEV